MEYKEYQAGKLLNNRYLKVNDISEGSYGLVTSAKDIVKDKLVAIKYIYPLPEPESESSNTNTKNNSKTRNISSKTNSKISLNSKTNSKITSIIKTNSKNSKKSLNSQKNKNSYEEALKEIQIHSKLGQHQNIATLYDHFENYLVLEYCSRGDLYEAIKTNQGPSQKNDIIDVMFQLIDVVKFIHSNSVYHRDIKPENILINEDWCIKLTDWGLSSTERICSDFGVGSERYMAPELFDRNIAEYDSEKVDFWSIGIVLLNLIFHKNPFKVANYSDKLFVHFASNREVLFDIFPTMSFELFAVLRFCLTIDPDNRDLNKVKQELLKINSFTIDDEFDDLVEPDSESEINELSSTNIKPIPIISTNNRKPLALPSYVASTPPFTHHPSNNNTPNNSMIDNSNVTAHLALSHSNKDYIYNRQDFFTPKSVFNSFMNKIDSNSSGTVNDVKRRPWRVYRNHQNFQNGHGHQNGYGYGHQNGHHGSSYGHHGSSYYGNSFNGYKKKESLSNSYKKDNYLSNSYVSSHSVTSNGNFNGKKTGKYIPPNLRSPLHKSVELADEIINLDLDDDDVFVLEENYVGEFKKPKSPIRKFENNNQVERNENLEEDDFGFYDGFYNGNVQRQNNNHLQIPNLSHEQSNAANSNGRPRASSIKLPCNKDGKYVPPNRRSSVVKRDTASSSISPPSSVLTNKSINHINGSMNNLNGGINKLIGSWDEDDGFYTEFLDKKYESIISTG